MEHQKSSFHLLAFCEHGYISTCTCCHEYNFTYKNLLLQLPEGDLLSFCSWLIDSQRHPENHLELPHGRNRIYCSPLANLYLVFNKEELNDISDMFMQVQLVLEARKIAMQR